jgi:hypothetical protein
MLTLPLIILGGIFGWFLVKKLNLTPGKVILVGFSSALIAYLTIPISIYIALVFLGCSLGILLVGDYL